MATTTTTTVATDPTQKMQELLKTMGAAPELAAQFGELLEGFISDQKTILEGKYKTKLDQAKSLCLEETKRFKAQLAKRVQIFLEAKSDKIESQIAKSVAIQESQSTADLTKIKALLEGVEVNANGNVDLEAIKNELGILKKKAAVLKEERDAAVTKANRANSVAQASLSRTRVLEEAAKKAPVAPATAAPIAESVAKPADAPAAPAIPARKTGAQAKTSRTIDESVTMPPKKVPATTGSQPTATMTWEPNNIAADMAD